MREPLAVADIGGPVEPEQLTDHGDRLRRAGLAEQRRGDVPGQHLGAGEDQDRDGPERDDAEREAAGNEADHARGTAARCRPSRVDGGCLTFHTFSPYRCLTGETLPVRRASVNVSSAALRRLVTRSEARP